MADNREWGSSTQVSASAVVDLEDTEMEIIDDASDYEMHFNGDGGRKRPEKGSPYMEEASRKFGANVTEAVFEVGKQQARKAWSVYGNIDILRPFFDVEPKEVTRRLLHSLVPVLPSAQRQRVPRELYGPLMVLLTMIALLLFQMKTSGHKVEEGTLMGTAFGVCFTYWLGASSFIWFLCYVCNTRLSFVQILSMVGYALFGHCVVLFMGTVIHTSHDHLYFYILWAVVGGLSSLRMASLVISRTNGKTQRLIVCSVLILLHLLFLLYLHFAYHQIVEEISEVFNEVKAIQPEAPMAGVENAVHERALDGAAEQPLNPVVESDAKSDVETFPESVEANVRHAMAADKGSVINAGLDVGKLSSNLTKQDLGKPLNETIKFPEKVLNSEK